MAGEAFDVVHVAEIIRGGIATYLREVTERQATRFGAGRVAVLTTEEQLGDLEYPAGVQLFSVERAGSRLQTAWRIRCKLLQVLNGGATRILHVHSSFAGMAFRIPGFKVPGATRIIYCPHGWGFVRSGKSARLAAYIEKGLSHYCDAIVCVSEAERQSALQEGLPQKKLRMIHNGMPDHSFVGSSTSDQKPRTIPLLLFVGRLDRAKGFETLVNALRCMKHDIELHAFGESTLGEYKPQELPDSLHMHGWQAFEKIERYLHDCDALIMPSLWEGLPMTAIEAMRAGKPVIASRVGGLPELVEDGETGVLVAPGDAQALAQVLDSLQPTWLAPMGRKARQRFLDQFLIERCESRLAELYQEILG